MKIASFKAGQTATYGVVTNAGVIDAGKRLKHFPTLKSLLANGSLDALKADEALDGMLVRKRGMRLSVQPVDPAHFQRVLKLGKSKLSAKTPRSDKS